MCTEDGHPTRILIADDHSLLRAAVRQLLDVQGGFDVVGEAANARETVILSRRLKPDIVLLDLSMPGESGLEVLAKLAKWPSIRVLLFTSAIENTELDEAFRLGARGVVLKRSTTTFLFDAIRAVMADDYWLKDRPVATLPKW